jgi:hypothetical protein
MVVREKNKLIINPVPYRTRASLVLVVPKQACFWINIHCLSLAPWFFEIRAGLAELL